MELQGERLIPASVDKTWAALNDPDTLKACIAGCESLERTGPDAFTAVVALRVGPVSARFKGNLQMTNITRSLRHRDPDLALQLADRQVQDWKGCLLYTSDAADE